MNPLHLAASAGHHNIVTFFLEKFKVDVSSRSRVTKHFHNELQNLLSSFTHILKLNIKLCKQK